MYDYVEDFIQRQFQLLSNYSQMNWGKNCYWWAYLWTHFSGVFSLFVVYYVYLEVVNEGVNFFRIAIIILAALMAFFRLLELPKLKSMSESDQPQSDNSFTEITIEDDGPGIPEDQYKNVFKPFFRLDKSRSLNKSGVGLGLAIVEDIVNSHGGNIQLGKSKLKGLQVKISLPF